MTTELKICCGDGVYKSEIEKRFKRAIKAERDQKWSIKWAIQCVQSENRLLLGGIADQPKMEFLFQHRLATRDVQLGWLFDALGGISDFVYKDYVLSGDAAQLE